MSRRLATILVCLLAAQTAAATGGPIYDAIDMMVDEFKGDAGSLAQHTSKTAITAVFVSDNLDEEIRPYTVKGIERAAEASREMRVINCPECFAIRAETKGQEVFLKKGITDRRDLAKMAARMGVNSHTEVTIAYTGFRASLQLSVYDVANSKLLWSKKYDKRVLGGSGLRFSLTMAQAIDLQNTDAYPLSIRFMAGEHVYGFGTFGLYVGGLIPLDTGGSFQVAFGPQITWNLNETILPAWSWGDISLKLYGGLGFSAHGSNLPVGGGVLVFVGSLFHFDIDYLHTFPLGRDKPEEASVQALLFGFGLEVG